MKFWPYDSFEIKTTMSEDEIVTLLNSEIKPRKTRSFFTNDTGFKCDVSLNGFKIIRIIHYQNGFQPIITGTFSKEKSGTTIKVNMELHPMVRIFMYIWLGFTGIGALTTTATLLSGHTSLSPMSLIPFVMLIFGCVLTSASFWFEAKKQKPLLFEIFTKENVSHN